jgi:FkbM family methyltransferase
MHLDPSSVGRTFFDRANDPNARDLPSRLSRFLRARLRRLCAAGMLLADDPRIVRAWLRNWDGPHFIQLCRWRGEGFRPRVVYDIGAHEGIWSQMCQAVLAPAECLLFEPQSEARAKAQLRQPGTGGTWRFLPVALGDRQETHVFHVTRRSAAASLLRPLSAESTGVSDIGLLAEQKVEVMPLDALVAAQGLPLPDLVKIDVQGFEGKVLAGGGDTLRHAERMVVEVSLHPLYDGQSLMPEVLQTLSNWGFELQEVQETFRNWPDRLWQVDLWLTRKT